MLLLDTVKPEIFPCPLFHKFRNFNKFVKIMGREYSISYTVLLVVWQENDKIKGAYIIS